jgi:hypothetical protein
VIRSGDCAATLSLIPEGIPGSIETDAFAFDPDAAKQALADSTYGSADGLPEVTLTYVNDDPAEQPRMEWIAGQFRDVLGVEVTLEGMESTAWVETLYDSATRPQLTPLGWVGDYPDPQNWLSTLFTCEGVESSSGYCNAEFDDLTVQADSELDEATRLDLYEQAAELLVSALGEEIDELLLDRATRVLHEMPHRSPMLDESKLLADAVNLEDFGLIGAVQQAVQLSRQGAGVVRLIEAFEKREEYGYWQARLKDGFHFEPVRQMARRRLENAREMFKLLQQEIKDDEP